MPTLHPPRIDRMHHDHEARPPEHLSLNFRYSGAWAEYNQRMVARHHVLSLYMTASTVTLGFLYTHRGDPNFNFWEVALVLPAASLIASILLYMHDCMMCNLHGFLIVCERHNNEGEGDRAALPGYHASPEASRSFLHNRQLQDYTILFIFFIMNVSPFYLLPGKERISILGRVPNWPAYLLVYVICCLLSWVFILEGRDRRFEAVLHHLDIARTSTFTRRLRRFTVRIARKYIIHARALRLTKEALGRARRPR